MLYFQKKEKRWCLLLYCKNCKTIFKAENVKVMSLLTQSPNLSSIETLWRSLEIMLRQGNWFEILICGRNYQRNVIESSLNNLWNCVVTNMWKQLKVMTYIYFINFIHKYWVKNVFDLIQMYIYDFVLLFWILHFF